MAQDPERDVDPSSDVDVVIVFSSSNHNAEMEATNIRGLLESNGIEAILVGPSVIPSLEFQVRVQRSTAEEARRLIAEARAAGPEAAAEAEASSEHP
jgi:Putative prokaryotic signal transducing protein